MAVMVEVDGKNFNNNNSSEVYATSWDEATHIVVIKIFIINLTHHSDFLAVSFASATFFTLAISNKAAVLFFTCVFKYICIATYTILYTSRKNTFTTNGMTPHYTEG